MSTYFKSFEPVPPCPESQSTEVLLVQQEQAMLPSQHNIWGIPQQRVIVVGEG